MFRDPVGASCQSARNCRSGLCSAGGYCTRYCRAQDDCPGGMRCVESEITLSSVQFKDARSGIPIKGNSRRSACQK